MPTSVAGIARKGDSILIMHRLPGGSVGGLWEFPGGKCEEGETPDEALKREWLEETALNVDVGPEVARGSFTHKGVVFELLAFNVILPSGDSRPALREHDDWRWATVSEMRQLDFVESDLIIMDALTEESA